MTVSTLWRWFAESVARCPRRSALEVGDHILTYADLDAVVARLARTIEDAAGGRPARVGILAAHTLAGYAGYLAAVRLGAAVVTLNPRFPIARNLAIVAATQLDLVLADEVGAELATLIGERSTARILAVGDAAVSRLAETPDPGPAAVAEAGPDQIAYIMFTSGSTGHPRGVPVRHRQIAPLLEWTIRSYGVGPDDRISQNCELTFDPSVHMMFTAWGAGAALIVPQPSDVVRPGPYINAKRITFWFCVPAVAGLAARSGGLGAGSLPTLTRVQFGGDRLTPAVAETFAAAAPNSTVYNTYGPTEVSVMCTSSYLGRAGTLRAPGTNGTYPIGRVLAHLEHVVLGPDLRPASAGELCVRGSQRFDGYLDPADNVGRFLRWEPGTAAVVHTGDEPLTDRHWYRTGDQVRTEDGELVFTGRVDFQVKIRGNRIELGEVETVLRNHPDIDDAVVVARDSGTGPYLLAVYTGAEVATTEIVAFVRGRLPVYMLPARFRHQDTLPLNPNGKVDRVGLTH